MKFETINNQLCRMLEKPDAINEFSKTPCVIAGKWGGLKKYYILGSPPSNPSMSIIAEGFEIIGYPVADGSAEWRNYQLMQGKCVCCPGDSEYYQASGQGRIIGRLIENNEFNSTWNSNTFMRDDSDGWHLYEPQPKPKPKSLLADAKVGDLCKRRDGKWVQVDSYSNDRPCPVMCKSDIGGQDCFTLDGRNHNAINDSKDIIATEPLAPKGTAEWAWQMLMLGKSVYNPAECYNPSLGIITPDMVNCQKDDWVEFQMESGWKLYEEPDHIAEDKKVEPEPGAGRRDSQAVGGEMTWHELKPETRHVLLDAIDRLKAAHEAQDSAVAHDKLCHEPEVKAAGDSLIQKVLMAIGGDL